MCNALFNTNLIKFFLQSQHLLKIFNKCFYTFVNTHILACYTDGLSYLCNSVNTNSILLNILLN
jgi:hypothetical protein